MELSFLLQLLPNGLVLGVMFDRPVAFFYLMLVLVVIVLGLIYLLVNSRIGRAFVAIKLNQPPAEIQGIDPLRYRLLAICISALVTGIAGNQGIGCKGCAVNDDCNIVRCALSFCQYASYTLHHSLFGGP